MEPAKKDCIHYDPGGTGRNEMCIRDRAQAESRFLLLSPNNLLKPSDGGPVAVPSQDMVLGIY